MNGLDVTFDEDAKVRVLDVEKFKQTEKLEKACKEFVSKIEDFSNAASSMVEAISSRAEEIEKAKLRAVGKRMKVEYEKENRKRKEAQLRALIQEKLNELDRLNQQHSSLQRVEQEQRELIEKLTSED